MSGPYRAELGQYVVSQVVALDPSAFRVLKVVVYS